MRMCDNVSARLCERTNDVADGDNMVSSCSEGGGAKTKASGNCANAV